MHPYPGFMALVTWVKFLLREVEGHYSPHLTCAVALWSDIYWGAAIEYGAFLLVAVDRGIASGSRGREKRPESSEEEGSGADVSMMLELKTDMQSR